MGKATIHMTRVPSDVTSRRSAEASEGWGLNPRLFSLTTGAASNGTSSAQNRLYCDAGFSLVLCVCVCVPSPAQTLCACGMGIETERVVCRQFKK